VGNTVLSLREAKSVADDVWRLLGVSAEKDKVDSLRRCIDHQHHQLQEETKAKRKVDSLQAEVTRLQIRNETLMDIVVQACGLQKEE
jgi:translation initiation factor 2 alpha subunit (eIF-2alpha)